MRVLHERCNPVGYIWNQETIEKKTLPKYLSTVCIFIIYNIRASTFGEADSHKSCDIGRFALCMAKLEITHAWVYTIYIYLSV